MSSRLSIRRAGVLSKLSFAAWLGLGAGCGSAVEDDSSDPVAPAPMLMPTSNPGTGPSPTPSAEAPPAPAPTSPSMSPAPSPAQPAVDPEGPTPAGTEGVAAVDACEALGSGDACGACVCGQCQSELDTCLRVPGCAEILACVRESGCSGRDCYCGEASLTECIRGEGDGPCKEVVLAAPGGRAPTLEDSSGGPASDASLGVSDCAENDEVCADVCGLAD